MYNIIDSLCKENGISIAQFCRESGVPQSTITELKHGRTMSLSHKNIVKAAEYFNVSTDYLLGNDTKKEPLVNDDQELTEYLEELKNRKEMRMLFSLAKGATKEDVERTVRIIEAALGKKADDD